MGTAFKRNFFWGSSTNAQQFEGGWDKGGKGLSIADVRKISGMSAISDFSGFKRASDHYTHYQQDIALYGEIGFQIYRFSMAWTRIFPNGDDPEASKEGLAFYDRILSELEKYKIQPVVTLYAYDLPLALLKKYNGWMNRECIKAYTRYVETVVHYYKGRVKYWIPFNEQNFLSLDSEYMTGYRAKSREEVFRLEHHFNLAYAAATKIVHQVDPEAKAGGNIGNICVYPKTCNPKDVEACDEFMKRIGYAPGDVYFRGKYPAYLLKQYEGINFDQIIHDGDLEQIKSVEPDFMSLTYYMSSAVGAEDLIEKDSQQMNGIKITNPFVKQTEWGWNIDPYGFKHYLEDFYHRYQLPILILENGLGHRDKIENDAVHDDYRIQYLAAHIERMKEAEADGVDLIGYLTWSATDLYSTREGFEKRYGFVYVDKATLKRTKKDSFYWYKKVIETNGADLSNK